MPAPVPDGSLDQDVFCPRGDAQAIVVGDEPLERAAHRFLQCETARELDGIAALSEWRVSSRRAAR
jgi:hypothetical protein